MSSSLALNIFCPYIQFPFSFPDRRKRPEYGRGVGRSHINVQECNYRRPHTPVQHQYLEGRTEGTQKLKVKAEIRIVFSPVTVTGLIPPDLGLLVVSVGLLLISTIAISQASPDSMSALMRNFSSTTRFVDLCVQTFMVLSEFFVTALKQFLLLCFTASLQSRSAFWILLCILASYSRHQDTKIVSVFAMPEDDRREGGFEQVIRVVGNDGPFQKRFNCLFNVVLLILVSMPYVNVVIAMSVPDHWCNVPGREFTNFSIGEWRDKHIPKENDSRGILSHSKCRMYNGTDENKSIVDCQYGWEFDKTWYEITAPSQEGWVCDKTLHVTNTFVFTKLGEVMGTFVFGQLADAIGRRPVFYMSLVIILIGRCMITVTSKWLPLFFLAAFIGSLPSSTIFEGTIIIGMEISKSAHRAYIMMLQCVAWTIGICAMPLIMWIVRDWVYTILITTLPSGLFLFSGSYLIESPRWLASKGKIKRCITELEKISKINRTSVPENAGTLLKIQHSREKTYGVLSLFSSWRLTKNTFMLMSGWSITLLIYYFLTINISNLSGNPFMNFFWQGLSELPAYILGKYASDKFGRRWASIGSFIGTALGCILLIYLIQYDEYAIYVTIISVFLKFSIALAYFVVNVQCLETYPTCVRQSGISISAIVGNSVTIVGPYIVYIGITINACYPYLICTILSLIGACTGFFLPETLNQRLPETLADAANFGADQNVWGKVVPRKEKIEMDESEKPLSS